MRDLWRLNTVEVSWTLILDKGPLTLFESLGLVMALLLLGCPYGILEGLQCNFTPTSAFLFSIDVASPSRAWTFRNSSCNFAIPACFSVQGMASIGSVLYMLRTCGWSDSPNDIYALEANAQQAQLVLLMAANR